MKKMLPTPLEKLQSDKLYAKVKSRAAAQRLNDNFTYIQNNTGGILLSSISSLIFPGTKTKKANNSPSSLTLPFVTTNRFGVSEVLSIGRTMFPHVWSIAKPVLFTWGIGRTRSMLLGKLFGRKKKKKK